MRIEWKVHKRAGHLRPKLYYEIWLEDFEIDLAVPMVRITSTIPKPPDAGQHYVWPGTKECGAEQPTANYELCSPSHRTGRCKEMLMLPMRTDKKFPEVEASFKRLREEYEKALLVACENCAYEEKGQLGMTGASKRKVAPAVAARRFLSVVGQPS